MDEATGPAEDAPAAPLREEATTDTPTPAPPSTRSDPSMPPTSSSIVTAAAVSPRGVAPSCQAPSSSGSSFPNTPSAGEASAVALSNPTAHLILPSTAESPFTASKPASPRARRSSSLTSSVNSVPQIAPTAARPGAALVRRRSSLAPPNQQHGQGKPVTAALNPAVHDRRPSEVPTDLRRLSQPQPPLPSGVGTFLDLSQDADMDLDVDAVYFSSTEMLMIEEGWGRLCRRVWASMLKKNHDAWLKEQKAELDRLAQEAAAIAALAAAEAKSKGSGTSGKGGGGKKKTAGSSPPRSKNNGSNKLAATAVSNEDEEELPPHPRNEAPEGEPPKAAAASSTGPEGAPGATAAATVLQQPLPHIDPLTTSLSLEALEGHYFLGVHLTKEILTPDPVNGLLTISTRLYTLPKPASPAAGGPPASLVTAGPSAINLASASRLASGGVAASFSTNNGSATALSTASAGPSPILLSPPPGTPSSVPRAPLFHVDWVTLNDLLALLLRRMSRWDLDRHFATHVPEDQLLLMKGTLGTPPNISFLGQDHKCFNYAFEIMAQAEGGRLSLDTLASHQFVLGNMYFPLESYFVLSSQCGCGNPYEFRASFFETLRFLFPRLPHTLSMCYAAVTPSLALYRGLRDVFVVSNRGATSAAASAAKNGDAAAAADAGGSASKSVPGRAGGNASLGATAAVGRNNATGKASASSRPGTSGSSTRGNANVTSPARRPGGVKASAANGTGDPASESSAEAKEKQLLLSLSHPASCQTLTLSDYRDACLANKGYLRLVEPDYLLTYDNFLLIESTAAVGTFGKLSLPAAVRFLFPNVHVSVSLDFLDAMEQSEVALRRMMPTSLQPIMAGSMQHGPITAASVSSGETTAAAAARYVAAAVSGGSSDRVGGNGSERSSAGMLPLAAVVNMVREGLTAAVHHAPSAGVLGTRAFMTGYNALLTLDPCAQLPLRPLLQSPTPPEDDVSWTAASGGAKTTQQPPPGAAGSKAARSDSSSSGRPGTGEFPTVSHIPPTPNSHPPLITTATSPPQGTATANGGASSDSRPASSLPSLRGGSALPQSPLIVRPTSFPMQVVLHSALRNGGAGMDATCAVPPYAATVSPSSFAAVAHAPATRTEAIHSLHALLHTSPAAWLQAADEIDDGRPDTWNMYRQEKAEGPPEYDYQPLADGSSHDGDAGEDSGGRPSSPTGTRSGGGAKTGTTKIPKPPAARKKVNLPASLTSTRRTQSGPEEPNFMATTSIQEEEDERTKTVLDRTTTSYRARKVETELQIAKIKWQSELHKQAYLEEKRQMEEEDGSDSDEEDDKAAPKPTWHATAPAAELAKRDPKKDRALTLGFEKLKPVDLGASRGVGPSMVIDNKASPGGGSGAVGGGVGGTQQGGGGAGRDGAAMLFGGIKRNDRKSQLERGTGGTSLTGRDGATLKRGGKPDYSERSPFSLPPRAPKPKEEPKPDLDLPSNRKSKKDVEKISTASLYKTHAIRTVKTDGVVLPPAEIGGHRRGGSADRKNRQAAAAAAAQIGASGSGATVPPPLTVRPSSGSSTTKRGEGGSETPKTSSHTVEKPSSSTPRSGKGA